VGWVTEPEIKVQSRMDPTSKIREAFVGWTVVGVEPYGREGGLRFTLKKDPDLNRVVGVFPGSQGGIHLQELKESSGLSPVSEEMPWMEFRAMISDLSMHSCPEEDQEINLVLSDEPMLRQMGFECKGCGHLWRISLSKLKASDHPWAEAMREVEHRAILAKHLSLHEVPAEWGAFFRGMGPFPG